MITTITTKTRNKFEPNNFPSSLLFPWYVLMRGFGIPPGQNRSSSQVIPLNFVRFPLNVLSGFPTAFCYGCPPPDFFTLSHSIKSGFPKAFCQDFPRHFVRFPHSILLRVPSVFYHVIPAFQLVSHQHFLQVFSQHFLRFPCQISTTHLHSWVKIEALRG